MSTYKSFEREIYEVNEQSFSRIALDVFHFQAENNSLYRQYLDLLRVSARTVSSLNEVPFLPISFFKRHVIKSGTWNHETVYQSSGTTGGDQSRHFVYSETSYLENSRRCFEHFFGPLEGFHFLALLPSYLEREGSSLITMIRHFIAESGSTESGFYLRDHDRLLKQLQHLKNSDRKTILWGVSFALLDLAEAISVDLNHCLIFETGGMKGRRREITRDELHTLLKARFNVAEVFSEYGMTELLSQAYTRGGLRFQCSPPMKVIGRELTDPFGQAPLGETAALNVIDLANWRTISFIATEDVGKVYADGSFEVLGRVDNSDARGCNLLL